MIQEIHYLVMNPTGNQTILVQSEIPLEKQLSVADVLMQFEPKAEQVGFLSNCAVGDISLRMAGGEFCGNATICAAVQYGLQNDMDQGQVTVCVSGAATPVAVSISRQENGMWSGIVEMPQPESISCVPLPDGKTHPLVSFPGISHVILEEFQTHEQAEKLAVSLCNEYGFDALGLMFLKQKENRLSPLVFVPAVNTLFWESACASGTTAVGAWLAKKQNKTVHAKLQQPGGTLDITASPSGPLLLQGTVCCIAEKTVIVEL